jgi:hypothetical protein
MDRNLWSIITRTIVAVNRSNPSRQRRPLFSDVLILRMYFWIVWHDRPLCWAAQRQHYGKLFQPRRLPSRSQFCRRVRSRRFGLLLTEICRRLASGGDSQRLLFLDGKALPVSESTQDPEAKTGHGNGVFSRGYKLHALGSEDGRIKAFCVRPLNEHEVPVTERTLVQHIPADALVLADGNYDSSNLYQQVHDRGAWLFTPLKGKRAKSPGRLRRMSLARRNVHELWGRRPKLCWSAYRHRSQIERIFSALTTFAGGLGPLPSWVRRLERVTRWVTAKITIYHARLLLRTVAC